MLDSIFVSHSDDVTTSIKPLIYIFLIRINPMICYNCHFIIVGCNLSFCQTKEHSLLFIFYDFSFIVYQT